MKPIRFFLLLCLLAPCASCSSKPEPAARSETNPPIVAPITATAPPPPSISKDEVVALVRSTIDDELRKRELQREQKQAAEITAERARRDAERMTAEQAAKAARQKAQADALLLLTPEEQARVEKIRRELATGLFSLGGLDMRFALSGIGRPILHEDLLAAANRAGPGLGEVDALFARAGLSAEEKIEISLLDLEGQIAAKRFVLDLLSGDANRLAPLELRFIRDKFPMLRSPLIDYLRTTRRRISSEALE